MTGVRKTGERVEELLTVLRSADRDSAAVAEELVGLLVGLYGDGLAHIVDVLAACGPHGEEIMAALTQDPLVESLLLLHDLHPLDPDARVQRALDQIRPYLGSHAGGVQYLGITGGVARLRLEGSCDGCPSSTVTVKLAIEGAVLDAAPEVTEVVVEGMTRLPEPALMQIGRRPPDGSAPDAGSESGWFTLPDIGPPSSRPVTATAGGMPVVVCAVRGTLYAYRDSCASCGGPLGEGVLERELLTCPGCGTRYNVRLAGQGAADAALHLDPLPLLTDSQGVRVALPETAAL
jgi:Fe-S cluster biogenesis protein NfuA/nitrite reductase/ring-hydroxylating ferredoxin subunit